MTGSSTKAKQPHRPHEAVNNLGTVSLLKDGCRQGVGFAEGILQSLPKRMPKTVEKIEVKVLSIAYITPVCPSEQLCKFTAKGPVWIGDQIQ